MCAGAARRRSARHEGLSKARGRRDRAVSSQIGLIGHPRAAAYAASKAGLNGLAKALAIELAPDKLRVNAVAPGPIATPMTAVARADSERHARMIASIPLGRFGEPDEGGCRDPLPLSPAASFITDTCSSRMAVSRRVSSRVFSLVCLK